MLQRAEQAHQTKAAVIIRYIINMMHDLQRWTIVVVCFHEWAIQIPNLIRLPVSITMAMINNIENNSMHLFIPNVDMFGQI